MREFPIHFTHSLSSTNETNGKQNIEYSRLSTSFPGALLFPSSGGLSNMVHRSSLRSVRTLKWAFGPSTEWKVHHLRDMELFKFPTDLEAGEMCRQSRRSVRTVNGLKMHDISWCLSCLGRRDHSMSLVTCLYVIGLVFENDLRHNSLRHQQ